MNRKFLLTLIVMMFTFALLIGCNSSESDGGGEQAPSENEETQSEGNAEGSETATNYPERTVEIYVPYNPGGQTDIGARILAKHMSEHLDEDFVVINQNAGSGAVAMDTVFTADPDGHTLFYGHQHMHTGYALGQYDHKTVDYTPVTTVTAATSAFVVNADAPWDDINDLIEDAKANPETISYGADIGGTTHFMGGMLTDAAGIELKILDGGTESERMAAILGGQIDLVITSVGNAAAYVESGDYKVLGVLSEERDPLAPDFPTLKEQGVDVQFSLVHGLFGPPELSDDIVKVWNDAMNELMENETYLEELKNAQQSPIVLGSQMTEFVQEEFDYIQELAKTLGF